MITSHIIVLSSGHVFAKGSVGAVGPFWQADFDCSFTIYGVGYEVVIRGYLDYYTEDNEQYKIFNKYRSLHEEATKRLFEV